MDFSKLDLSTDLSFEYFISKFREFCDYSNSKQDTLVDLQQIQGDLSLYKRTMLSLNTELKQIKKENKELLLKVEQLQIIYKQNKDIQLIQSDINTILSLIKNQQIQNKEILLFKNDIQNIQNKICNFKEEIKQHINSHTRQIQNKEEQLFKNEIQDIKNKICNFKGEIKQHINSHTRQIQNKEILLFKNDIQNIQDKICNFKEEMKQHINSHTQQIQNKEEVTFISLKTSILPELQSIKQTLDKYKDISIMKEEFNKLENLLLAIQLDTNYLSKEMLSQPLKKLEDYISIDNIHSNTITSIIELQDKRIALCSYDKSITVYSINYEEKKWTQDIKLVNAHEDNIFDICEISINTLASVSPDKKIKIWKINKNNLELLSTLTQHTDKVHKVITLNNEQFATCSWDKTIKIWNNISPFNEVKTLTHDGQVTNMIKLKTKEIILSSNWTTQSIDFWDLTKYVKIKSVNGVYTHSNTHEMIELPNTFVAVSSASEGKPIIIIDPSDFYIVKKIRSPEYITGASALCVLDCHSFIYVWDGKELQFSIDNDYQISYKSKNKSKLKGRGEMITVTNIIKFIIIPNKSNGIEIMKLSD